jgi:hypothetical protein
LLKRLKLVVGFVLALVLLVAACGGENSNVSPTPEPSSSEPAASTSADSAAALASLQAAASALYADCVSEQIEYECNFTVDLVGTTLGIAKNTTFLGANAFLGSYVVVCFYDVEGTNYVYRSGTKTSTNPTLGVTEEALSDGVDSVDFRHCPGAVTP